ncbi:hypothetical protein Tco_0757673 [Tanacetum coccineum]
MMNTPERLFSTFDGVCHQTFCAARSYFMRNSKSDNDDEEEYQIKRNKFRAPIYGLKPAPYLNCTNPEDRSSAIQTVTNPFQKVSVWKKAISFLGSLLVLLNQVNWKPDYKGIHNEENRQEVIKIPQTQGTHDNEAGSSISKRPRQHETVEEILLTQVHHEFLLCEGCSRDAKSRMGYDGEINDMLRIMLCEAGSDEEIFTLVALISAFNINEPIYAELCHEFYLTYEFDEVCADDELQTKKIIKFILCGRAHNSTLLEFARRLGLYQAVDLEEESFNVYFEGGLRNDEHFNAQDDWLSISREENLGLSRSHTSTIKIPILRNGYANVDWVIARWMKRKGAGTQKESQICCGQFISKIARKCRVLTKDVIRSLSAPIYYRDLDTITLRDLIKSEGKLIPEDPKSGVSRVGIPRPLRASMQDLYDRMGRMEIRQDAIERMEYRQSYHWDRYHEVFEHMAGVYSVLLQRAYNPPGYAQPQKVKAKGRYEAEMT